MNPKSLLVTGSSGFIGAEAVSHFRRLGWDVVGMDWRAGAMTDVVADICDIGHHPVNVDSVLHLAAQTAVTHSIVDPFADFHTNVAGTVELIKWFRWKRGGKFLYASTNKVYGELRGVSSPIHDDMPLDPQTPYGVSKATADIYVRELLPDAGFVLRQSCIYGATQKGTEDQGWVAHVRNCVRKGKPITCYGDGSQVRDLLHVDDLLQLYEDILTGNRIPPGAYVVGGGPERATTFKAIVEELGGTIASFEPWRPFDQRYFVSANDISRYGWTPHVSGVGGGRV